jgi:general secretion pathway protein F
LTAYHVLVVTPEGRDDWRTFEAPSERSAVARAEADGLIPIEVRTGHLRLVDRLDQPVRFGGKPGVVEQALILTQLAMLVGAGLPIDRSLDLLRDQSPRASQRDLLAAMLTRIRGGGSLAQAFEESDVFPGYVIGVVRAAERSGRLGPALVALAERMTAVAATRRQLVTAMTYPAAVLVATILALVLVLTLVVPQFAPIFAGEEKRLPTLTRGVLILSNLVTDHCWLLLAMLVGLPLALVAIIRSNVGTSLLQRYRQFIPGLSLRDQYLAAELTGVLGTLIANGVSVVGALPLARGATASKRWREHLMSVERSVREGGSLSRSLGRGDFVPTTAVRLIEVGERGGQLAETCLKASAIMGEAAKARIDRIVALANPIAIMTLGGLVAMLVGGVMLGIFALGDFVG